MNNKETNDYINTENSEDLNIVQAYKLKNQKLIILISGMSGSGKSFSGAEIAIDFEAKHFKMKDYFKKDYSETVELPNGKEVINWFCDEAYDWNRLNKDVNKHKKKGVVISGLSFPLDKLNFEPDIHINISIKKNVLLDHMSKLLTENKDKFPDKYEEMMSGEMKLLLNKLSYPYFLDSIEKTKIDKFLNINDITKDNVYDKVFDALIQIIDKKVHKMERTHDLFKNNTVDITNSSVLESSTLEDSTFESLESFSDNSLNSDNLDESSDKLNTSELGYSIQIGDYFN